MASAAPIFAACKRRIYLTKIVRILRRAYSKRQILLSFTIVWKDEGFQPFDLYERHIISEFRELNETGQQKAADYVEDLTKIPEYQKKD